MQTTFSEIISGYIEENNLSNEEFSRELGVGRATVERWLASRTEPMETIKIGIYSYLHAEKEKCKFCGRKINKNLAHVHQGGYVGNCCWDERLKITE